MSAMQAKGRYGLIVTLILSIALNLLLVGYLIGKEQTWRGEQRMAPPHSQIGHFLRQQNDVRRAELAPLARQYLHTSRNSLSGIREARQTLNDAIATEPLDEADLEAAMAQVDQALLRSSHMSQRAMLPIIRALSPEERAQLAASSPAWGRHGGRHGGRDGGHRDRAGPVPERNGR